MLNMPYKINDEIYIYRDYNDIYREIITDIEIPIMGISTKTGGSYTTTYSLNSDKTYFVFDSYLYYLDHYNTGIGFFQLHAQLQTRTFTDFEMYLYEKFRLNENIKDSELINLYNEYVVKLNLIIDSSIEDYNNFISKADYSEDYEKIKIKEKANKLKKIYKI